MFSQRFALVAAVVSLTGCVTSAPAPQPPADAGTTEAEVVAAKFVALEAEAQLVLAGVDTALWTHWTTGEPLELRKVREGHEGLLSPQTLTTLRRAKELKAVEPVRIDDLERWVAGELLSQGVADESASLAALEATLTFTLDGRELAWRDLPRLLVSEQSTVKRRALWTASHAAALKLDEAIALRDARLAQVTQALGLPADFELRSRGLTSGTLRADAEALLSTTDDEWKTTLQRLSDADVKLPLKALTRGDLPRVLRVPANVDAEFSQEKLTARLSTLGGLDALKLDLTEAPRKSFVPLAVAPSPTDVRVSVRPAGGLREQQQVLSEIGLAFRLHGARRLSDPAAAMNEAELYAALVRDDAWLTDAGVTLRGETIAASRALWLFAARRAAALVLSKLETSTDEAAARAKYVELMSRAMGLTLPAAEGARLRIETSDAWRAASQLDAMLKAEKTRATLDGGWWKTPPSKRRAGEAK